MMKQVISCILILIISMFSLTGCYDNSEVNSLAFVIALGIDKGDNGLVKLTLQFAKSGETEEGGGTKEEDSASVITVEATSIPAGINLIDTYISKKVNLYHCKIIVFSEEVATQDVRDTIYSLITNLEIRNDASVLVTRSKAEDFIKSSKPTLEKVTAKYYQLAETSENTTGYITNETIISFYTKLSETFIEPVAILGGIHEDSQVTKTSPTNDGMYKAEEIPILNKPNTAMMGLAVFKDAKMVGELNGLETICYLIVSNQLKNCTISVPNTLNNNGIITVTLSLKNKTKNTVQLQNGSPYIVCKPKLEANIVSMEEGLNYLDKDYIRQVEDSINRYVEKSISEYLYKTSKEYKSDISGLGKYLVRNYVTTKEWEEVKWGEIYKDSFFNVQVQTVINNANLLVKT